MRSFFSEQPERTSEPAALPLQSSNVQASICPILFGVAAPLQFSRLRLFKERSDQVQQSKCKDLPTSPVSPIARYKKLLGSQVLSSLAAARRQPTSESQQPAPPAVSCQNTQAKSHEPSPRVLGKILAANSGVSAVCLSDCVRVVVPAVKDRQACSRVLAALEQLFESAPQGLDWQIDLSGLEFIPASVVSTLLVFSDQLSSVNKKIEITVNSTCYYTRFVSNELRKRLQVKLAATNTKDEPHESSSQPISLSNSL